MTIVRRTAGTADQYGNPTHTTQLIQVENVLVAFGSSSEPVEVARNPIDAGVTLYFPNGTQIHSGDEFEVRGERWVKDGDPQVWPTVNGFAVGVVVPVRRRRG